MSRIQVVTRVLILIACVLIARAFVDPAAIWKTLIGLRWRTLLLALILAVCDRVLMAYKWRQLIQASGGNVPLGPLVWGYFQATFAGYVLPSAVASEVVRGYLASQLGIGRAVLLVSMAAERVIGAIAAALLGVVALAILGVHMAWPLTIAVGCTTGAAVLWIVYGSWVVRRLPAPFDRLGRQAVHLWSGGPRHKEILILNLGLAVGEQLLQLLVVAVIARGLGISMSAPSTIAAVVVILTVRRAIAYIETWGLAEGVTIGLYTMLGLSAERAAALAITSVAVLLTASLPGGVLLLKRGVLGAARRGMPPELRAGNEVP